MESLHTVTAPKTRSSKAAPKRPPAPKAEERKKSEEHRKGEAKAAPRKPVPMDGDEEQALPEEIVPLTRVLLIRARHEFMKREIDQIREDLEADNDD
jgi:hypothetical protein